MSDYVYLDFAADYDLVGEPNNGGRAEKYLIRPLLSREAWANAVKEHLQQYLKYFYRGGEVDQVNTFHDYDEYIYDGAADPSDFEVRYKFTKFCETFPVLPCGADSEMREILQMQQKGRKRNNRGWVRAVVHDYVYRCAI